MLSEFFAWVELMFKLGYRKSEHERVADVPSDPLNSARMSRINVLRLS